MTGLTWDWAYLGLADLGADEFNPNLTGLWTRGLWTRGLWTRGLLIRRNISDGALAYFSTWCPASTGIEKLVGVEGQRWSIEEAFETAKNELGLDHNETRSWHGWHRHVSLVILAFAMLATIRHHANRPAFLQTPPRLTHGRQSSSAGRSRKSAASPRALHNAALSRPRLSPGRSGDARTRPPHNAHI